MIYGITFPSVIVLLVGNSTLQVSFSHPESFPVGQWPMEFEPNGALGVERVEPKRLVSYSQDMIAQNCQVLNGKGSVGDPSTCGACP